MSIQAFFDQKMFHEPSFNWGAHMHPPSTNYNLLNSARNVMKLGATGPGKSQLSFAPLFMSIRAFSDQKTFRELSSNWGGLTCNNLQLAGRCDCSPFRHQSGDLHLVRVHDTPAKALEAQRRRISETEPDKDHQASWIRHVGRIISVGSIAKAIPLHAKERAIDLHWWNWQLGQSLWQGRHCRS